MNEMIRVRDLLFRYSGTPFCLAVPQWDVAAGEQVAIVGPSGSGKTTLLHLLAGILTPQQGRIEMDGQDLCPLSDAARRNFRATQVGLVFQRFELIEYLTVAGNILLPYSINLTLRLDATVRQRLLVLAQRTGIEHLLRRPVQRLSQGEQQRVAICRALITQPRWILADEPTGNLDPENKRTIVELLQQQATESGATLIMVTHDVSSVAQFPRQVDFRDWCQTSVDSGATKESS
jgi:putative ABC transport system ATP-binding protein